MNDKIDRFKQLGIVTTSIKHVIERQTDLMFDAMGLLNEKNIELEAQIKRLEADLAESEQRRVTDDSYLKHNKIVTLMDEVDELESEIIRLISDPEYCIKKVNEAQK